MLLVTHLHGRALLPPQDYLEPNSAPPKTPCAIFLWAWWLRLPKTSKCNEQNQELSSGNLGPAAPSTSEQGAGKVASVQSCAKGEPAKRRQLVVPGFHRLGRHSEGLDQEGCPPGLVGLRAVAALPNGSGYLGCPHVITRGDRARSAPSSWLQDQVDMSGLGGLCVKPTPFGGLSLKGQDWPRSRCHLVNPFSSFKFQHSGHTLWEAVPTSLPHLTPN